jgi:hypothetical protein
MDRETAMTSKRTKKERNFWAVFILLSALDLLIGWFLSGFLGLDGADGLSRVRWTLFFWFSASALRWLLFRVQIDRTKWWVLAANLFALTSVIVGALSISAFFLVAADAAFPVSQLVLTSTCGAVFGISSGVWSAWFIRGPRSG